MDIIEITKNNEKQYLEQIAELGQIVLEAMKKKVEMDNYLQQEKKIYLIQKIKNI